LTLDHITPIARIPLEQVVARPEERYVVAPVAIDEVVSVASDQPIRATAPQDAVVPRRRA
jgi:hypothetical protein